MHHNEQMNIMIAYRNDLKLYLERKYFSIRDGAATYLQPHYGNGVFGNVYLLALDNTKR